MREHLAAIQAFLAAGGVLQTRLRESSKEDVHDFPTVPPALPGVSGRPEDIVASLTQLEQAGVVRRCSEVVHPHDSAEYRITWGTVEAQQVAVSRP